MASGWAMNGALKVVNEYIFQILPRVDRVMSQALEPRQGADSRAIGKYMTLVEFVPPATSMAVE